MNWQETIRRRVSTAWKHVWVRRMTWMACGLVVFMTICLMMVPRPLFRESASRVAFARDGGLIAAQIADDGQWRFTQEDSVPERFEKCIITFEDKRFRYHLGIDPIAIVRALRSDIRQGRAAEGGSTLTMQLARMAHGGQARTIGQKVVEALCAVGIELTRSKDEILSLYASHAPMGGNVVGLEAASWRYFGRRAAELSWAESALLAVLPNAPARIHVARNREALKEKRDRLLKKLLEDNEIDSATYELSVMEPLPEKPYPIENKSPQLFQKLSRNADTRGKATVHTTIDGSLQTHIQSIADEYSRRYMLSRVNDIGVLVAEVKTGNVLAYIGNSTRVSPTWMVDMVSAERSSGSTLKPLLYATMLSGGEMTPRSLWADTPLDINGFSPQNYSHTYNGAVHADEALTRSLNVPLVRMLSHHNTGRFLADLKQMGISTLRFDEGHYGASLILGGAEVTLWDLCGMYASMARRLISYEKDPESTMKEPLKDIFGLRLTPDGEFRHPQKHVSATVPTPAAIWYTFKAMADLSRPEEEADWQMFSSMKRVAWKTGTSYGGRDGWSVGVTRDYVVGVWTGNATGEGRAGMTGVGYAAPVMFDVFSLLPSSAWFEEPLDDEDEMVVCRRSGMLATDVCAEVDTVRLPRQCSDSKQCGYCRLVHLTADGSWQVNSSCESTDAMRTESRFVLPPKMEYYFKAHHADYEPLPPMRTDCADSGAGRVAIIYPQNGQKVVRTRSLEGKLQGVVCQVASGGDVVVYWHLDDTYLGETHGTNQMLIEPSAGQHRLTVVTDAGQTSAVSFSVK